MPVEISLAPKSLQNIRKTSRRPAGAPLVDYFGVAIVTLQLSEDVVGVSAAEVAEAGLDPQHLPGEARPVGTLELHVHGLGLVGDAAALVRAHAAVLGPVGLRAGAA